MTDKKKSNEIDFEAIKNAYGWTLSVSGEVMALTDGDMGYVPTGIVIDQDTLKACKIAVDSAEASMVAYQKIAYAFFLQHNNACKHGCQCPPCKALRDKGDF